MSKFKNSDEEKENKQSSKKSKKKGKKSKKLANSGYIADMNLDEEVLDFAQEHLQELLTEENDYRNGALQRLEDGQIVAIALTDMLLADVYDPDDSDYGGFVNDIIDGRIPTLRFSVDLEAGFLIILPTEEAIAVLGEYDFVRDLNFHWALIPAELSEDMQTKICSDLATYDDLVEVVRERHVLMYDNGEDGIVALEDDTNTVTPSVASDAEDPSANDSSIFDTPIEDSDIFENDFEPVEEIDDDPFSEMDAFDEESFEPVEDEVIDDELSFDEFDGYQLDAEDAGTEESFDEEVTIEEEAVHATINSVADYSFYNDEFDVVVNDDFFNRNFNVDNFKDVLFDETVSDPNSELERVLAQKRKDINRELIRIHTSNLANLRTQYFSNITKAHDVLLKKYDIQDPETDFGKRYAEIVATFDALETEIPLQTEQLAEELTTNYENERERFAKGVYEEAIRNYDLDHKQNFDAELEHISSDLQDKLNMDRAKQEGRLRADRRNAFRSDFDKYVTKIGFELQKRYRDILKNEFLCVDEFRLNLDKFMRDHYADDVARAKALRANENHMKEVAELRKRYDELLSAKQRELENQIAKNDQSDKNWQNRYNSMMSEIKAQYDEETSKLQMRNERLQNDLVNMDDTKSKEYEHKLKVLENLISAQKAQLETYEANERKHKFNGLSIIAGAGIFALIVGMFTFGGILYTHQDKSAKADTTSQQAPTVYIPQNYYSPDRMNDTKNDTTQSSSSKSANDKNETTTSSSAETTTSSAKTSTSASK